MANCCPTPDDDTAHPRKLACPRNGRQYAEVSAKTIALHIKEPWLWNGANQRYFFCDDPDCDIVYFGENGSLILKSALRTPVGAKDNAADATLCYCYGVSRADALQHPDIRDYVVGQTRQCLCACDTRNPSGRCCLKDFPARSLPGSSAG